MQRRRTEMVRTPQTVDSASCCPFELLNFLSTKSPRRILACGSRLQLGEQIQTDRICPYLSEWPQPRLQDRMFLAGRRLSELTWPIGLAANAFSV